MNRHPRPQFRRPLSAILQRVIGTRPTTPGLLSAPLSLLKKRSAQTTYNGPVSSCCRAQEPERPRMLNGQSLIYALSTANFGETPLVSQQMDAPLPPQGACGARFDSRNCCVASGTLPAGNHHHGATGGNSYGNFQRSGYSRQPGFGGARNS